MIMMMIMMMMMMIMMMMMMIVLECHFVPGSVDNVGTRQPASAIVV